MQVHSLLVATRGVGKGGWAGPGPAVGPGCSHKNLCHLDYLVDLWSWGISGGKRCHVEFLVSLRGRITMQTLGFLERGQALWGAELNVF